MTLKNTNTTLINTLHQGLKACTETQRITWAKQIVDEGVDVKELADRFLYGERTAAMRFSWLLSGMGIYSPITLFSVLPYLFEKREQTSIKDFRYQFVKYWSIAGIPKENTAEAINLLFSWLNAGDTNVSTKTHAMQNLYNLSKEYPDLKNELVSCIENKMDKTSISFRTRAVKILEELKRAIIS